MREELDQCPKMLAYQLIFVCAIFLMVLISGCGPSLKEAVIEGNIEYVRKILHRGADRIQKEYMLELAAAEGHSEIVDLLLQDGCPPTDHALVEASKFAHLDIVKMLVDRGGNPDAQVRGERLGLAEDTGREYIVHIISDPRGPSALGYATRRGFVHIVEFLLTKGANPNAEFIWKQARWPLMELQKAVSGEQESDYYITYRYDVRPPSSGYFRKEEISTPLIVATIVATEDAHILGEGRPKIVKLLLDHGADVNLTDSKGLTALMHAEMQGNREIINLLKNAR